MLVPFIALALAIASAPATELPGNLQLQQYLQEHPKGSGIMTTSYGYPVSYEEAYGGSRRDSNLLSAYSYEQLSSFALERTPPRGVHTNGSGAKGYFKVTHDVSNITNVNVFNGVGKKTNILARFSTSNGEIGSSEVLNRNKGMAVKFYTEEGNLDLIGIGVNTFAIKDPKYAVNFAHPFKANSKTGVPDSLSALDFVANNPTALFAFILASLDKRGQPKSYRHLPLHAIHTFQVENNAGKVSFVKFHWMPNAGLEYLSNDEYKTLAATNPDYFTMDLYNAISNGTHPSWKLYMQVIPAKEVSKQKFDIFDVTVNWPEKDYPYHPIGEIELNKHVDNHFAEIEQAAFNPSNLVPGIRGFDGIFLARTFIYRDSQIHRMGTGFSRIPVNCPISGARTFNRDGMPPVGDNGGDAINYYPNSFNGLVPSNRTQAPLVRPNTVSEPTNYWQVADYYNDLPEEEKPAIVKGLAATFAAVPSFIRDKLVAILVKVDTCLADEVDAVMKQIIASKAASG